MPCSSAVCSSLYSLSVDARTLRPWARQPWVSAWLTGGVMWRRASPLPSISPLHLSSQLPLPRIPFLGVKGYSLGCASIPDNTTRIYTECVWGSARGCKGRRGLTATISLYTTPQNHLYTHFNPRGISVLTLPWKGVALTGRNDDRKCDAPSAQCRGLKLNFCTDQLLVNGYISK